MIGIEEEQALSSLSEVAQNIKTLVAPMKEWVLEQGEADEKACRPNDARGSS